MSQRPVLQWSRPANGGETEREPLPAASFRIGAFKVDPTSLMISNGVRSTRVERKVMEVFLCLARTPGETVTRETLFESAWPGTFVTDGVLHRVVSILRAALGDDARHPSYVETVPRVGYRLMQPVEWSQPDRSADARKSRSVRWLWAALAGAVAIAAALAWLALGDPSPRETVVRPLTAEQGWEFDPAITRDGRWLAYVHFEPDHLGGLYVSAADGGSPRRLLAAAEREVRYPRHPAWSPDGTELAWVETAGEDPHDNRRCRVVTQPLAAEMPAREFPCAWASGVDWSPDGRSLLFNDVDPNGALRVREVDLETTDSRWISSPPEGHKDGIPRYSPDGTRIALVRSQVGIRSFLVVIDERGRETATYEPDIGFLESADWLTDSELVVSIENGYGVGELWRLGLSGGSIERIPESGHGRSPTVADGRIVYSRDEIASGIWAVARSGAADATPAVRIQSTRIDVNPQVSPAGAAVAFVSERSGSPQMWLSAAGDGEASLLTDLDVHWLGPPRWSPDGERLLFESRSAEGFTVKLLDLASESLETLELPFETHREPSWGPDGQLLVSSPVDGVWQLWVRGREGRWRQLTTHGGFVSAVGPGGEWLYYTKFEQPGLWRMPVGGGPEQQIDDRLDYHNRRNWTLTPDSLVMVRGALDHRVLIRQSLDSPADAAIGREQEIAVLEESIVLGVSASEEDVYYGVLEFEGSDIYAIEAG